MRKRIFGFAAAVLAGLLLLTACSSSDQSQSAAGSGSAEKKTEDRSVSENPQDVSGTQSVQGSAVGGAGSVSQSAEEVPAQAGGTGAEGAQTGSSVQDADVSGGSQETTDVQPSDSSESAADIWSGTYIGDEETVSLTKLDDGTVSFSFAQSGISGSAKISGSQAVYHGDDHYVVVFNINDAVLDVSVSSEEDYDASESPLNGTYVRDAAE